MTNNDPRPLTLAQLPQEVLERIGILTTTTRFSTTDTTVGPPSDLACLSSTNRFFHSRLSLQCNEYLYAKIFPTKFDIGCVERRIGGQKWSTPANLARELKRRFTSLHRLRAGCVLQPPSHTPNTTSLTQLDNDANPNILLDAYTLLLENDSRNERQLREFGRIREWLNKYWFCAGDSDSARDGYSKKASPSSTSSAYDGCSSDTWISPTACITEDRWPHQNQQAALAMWVFWFLFRSGDYPWHQSEWRDALKVLKVYALAAHRYHLASPSWADFHPQSHLEASMTPMRHYTGMYNIFVPPLAIPAIMAFVALISDEPRTNLARRAASDLGNGDRKRQWDGEWNRSTHLGDFQFSQESPLTGKYYQMDSLEGTWEGIFTYTEFTGYAMLLGGAPPSSLQRCLVVRHRQLWKLREYHLFASDGDALPAGSPLVGYIPAGTTIEESQFQEWLDVRSPGGSGSRYVRASRIQPEDAGKEVIDVIVVGEGHSAWGQCGIRGRVRPCDGFISLAKEYVSGDRGRWVYRGYLVGSVQSQLSGRWRDTISPTAGPGYEGCFAMSRRGESGSGTGVFRI